MTNFLFIGGDSDGERVYLSQAFPNIRRQISQRFPILGEEKVTCRDENYIQRMIHGEDRLFSLYLLEGLNDNIMIEKLIEHYNPRKEKKK